MKRTLMLCLSMLALACGSSPNAPTGPTTVAIGGTTDMIRMQETVTFAATATLPNGSTASVTDWSSDAPAIMSINQTTGVATGLSSGAATITARHNGAVATRAVRVVPRYDGSWNASYRITSCTDTGEFQSGGWCGLTNGAMGFFFLTLAQTRDTVTGTMEFGSYVGTVSGTIAVNGTLTLTGTTTLAPFSIAIASWATNSLSVGAMTGTFTQRATSTAITGNAVQTCQLESAIRTPPAGGGPLLAGQRSGTVGGQSVAEMARGLLGRQ